MAETDSSYSVARRVPDDEAAPLLLRRRGLRPLADRGALSDLHERVLYSMTNARASSSLR